MDLIFEQLRTGGDRNFGYLLGDRDKKCAVLIDPSYAPEILVARAAAQQLHVSAILNTHSHHDHTNGNTAAESLTSAPLAAFERTELPAKVRLKDGETMQVGGLRLRMLHTPGHCSDHLVVFVEDVDLAITGDLLFVGKVGGTHTEEVAREEWKSIQRVLDELPSQTTIWPGHDYGCRPSSTLALERRFNPFLRDGCLDAFMSMKSRWAEVKRERGLC